MRRGRTAKHTLSDLKTGRHPSFIEQKANKKNYLTVSLLPKDSGAAATLASCTTCLCLCKSLKDRSLKPLVRCLPESGCKGTTFFRTTKTFREKISVFMQKSYRS